jgi:hypothetical protein
MGPVLTLVTVVVSVEIVGYVLLFGMFHYWEYKKRMEEWEKQQK